MLNQAYVDLRVIKKNAKNVKKRLKNGVKFCAVVKANGYGHGAVAVANALYRIADCFAVATVEEGVELRVGGIQKEILVLSPTKYDYVQCINYGLSFSVGSIEEIKLAVKVCKDKGAVANVHLAYNSGMNREGVEYEELSKALNILKKQKYLRLAGFYSHFANPENRKDLEKALCSFLLAKKTVKMYNKNTVCHISASGGFLRGVQQDMVRIGILLYGYKPFATARIQVYPALKIKSTVIKRRSVKKGQCVLYGRKKTVKDTDISIVRFGYADGLFRKQVKGQFNNRCMDVTAVDKTIKSNDYVVMENAEKLAKKYDTISYEILTSLSDRVERIYKK